jgi:hypothetical protein
MADAQRHKTLDLLVAMGLGGAAFALYTATLAPTVLAGDGGEFQFVPYLLGVAHPTGYPLYTLLGWAWSHLLPVGDVAYRMNLFSATAAALAVVLVYPTAGHLLRQVLPALAHGIRRLVAVWAAMTFALTPTLWSQALIAEVYGLHIFFTVLIFYLLLTWGERRQPRFLCLVALAFGLSLAHHSTTLLMAPALLAYVWLTDRRVFRDWRLLIGVLLLVLLPLSFYLLIPFRAPDTPYLRLPLTQSRELVLYEVSWSNFVNFVLGGPFRGSVDLSVDLVQRLAMSWGFLRDEVGWLGVTLALLGLARLAAGRPVPGGGRHWALLILTGLAYLVSVAFNLVYTIGDIYVMYIPSYFVIVLWGAVGVGTLALLFAKKPVASLAVVLLLFSLPLWSAVTHYNSLDQSENTGARNRWEAILDQPLQPGAILVSNDRNNIMPMWYLQYVEGQRLDWLGLFPLITPDYPTLGHVLDLALETGRPVYLTKEMPGVEVKVQVEEGPLWQVLGPAAGNEPDQARADRLGEAVMLVGYDRSPHGPRPGESLQISLYWEALHPLDVEYHSFVHLVDVEGRVIEQSDGQPGGRYYPTALWRPGERLRDDHFLSLPADVPDGVYTLLAGMYALSKDGAIEALGEPAAIGRVAVKSDVPTEPQTMGHRTGATFARAVELLGYDTSAQQGTLEVTLHWRSLEPLYADYTVFVHLLDDYDQVIAQDDAQPQGGAYPTSVWDGGEVIVDTHSLALPPDLPEGTYRLRVGLYRPETGQRLPLDGNGDSVELGPVELDP